VRIALAAVLLAVLLTATAEAGQYRVTTCPSGPGASGWTAANSSPGALSVDVACPAALGQALGGLTVAASGGAGAGAAAGWTVSAPPPLRITHLAVERYLGARNDGWVAGILTAEGTELDRCERPWWADRCERGDASGPGPRNAVAFAGLQTRSVSFVVRCTATTCAGASSLPAAWLAVYGATVTVEDPAPPTVSGLSGTITAPGWHTGTDTASFSAADASGVKQLRLLAGATELARQDQACDYGRMQPCPAQANASVSVGMSRVPDGTHELRAVAVDAAGQEGAAVGTLRVDRTAPAAPEDVVVERAEDGTYTLRWTNPPQGTAAPVVAAHFALCDPLGVTCEAAGEARGAGVERAAGVTLPGPEGARTLRVWLEDEAGNVDPAGAAVLSVDTSARALARVIDTRPPALLPSGPDPSPRLRITRTRRSGATLTVSGTVVRAARARIEARVSRRKSGKPVLVKARVKPRRGHWTARVKLPRALRGSRALYLTVAYAGRDGYRATTVRRRVAARGG
jgi:hypothetical protein